MRTHILLLFATASHLASVLSAPAAEAPATSIDPPHRQDPVLNHKRGNGPSISQPQPKFDVPKLPGSVGVRRKFRYPTDEERKWMRPAAPPVKDKKLPGPIQMTAEEKKLFANHDKMARRRSPIALGGEPCPTSGNDIIKHGFVPAPRKNAMLFVSGVQETNSAGFAAKNNMDTVQGLVFRDRKGAMEKINKLQWHNCDHMRGYFGVAAAMQAEGDVGVLLPPLRPGESAMGFPVPTGSKVKPKRGEKTYWEGFEWPALEANEKVCRVWRYDTESNPNADPAKAKLIGIKYGGACPKDDEEYKKYQAVRA